MKQSTFRVKFISDTHTRTNMHSHSGVKKKKWGGSQADREKEWRLKACFKWLKPSIWFEGVPSIGMGVFSPKHVRSQVLLQEAEWQHERAQLCREGGLGSHPHNSLCSCCDPGDDIPPWDSSSSSVRQASAMSLGGCEVSCLTHAWQAISNGSC